MLAHKITETSPSTFKIKTAEIYGNCSVTKCKLVKFTVKLLLLVKGGKLKMPWEENGAIAMSPSYSYKTLRASFFLFLFNKTVIFKKVGAFRHLSD